MLLPIYLLISVAFPLAAVKLGRRVGMRYRERLGQMKAFVLESIYGLKDIQIFGAGNRRMEQVTQRGQAINRAAHGLTLHQQAVSSVPTFFVYLARISIVAVAPTWPWRGRETPVAASYSPMWPRPLSPPPNPSPPWSPAYWRLTPQQNACFSWRTLLRRFRKQTTPVPWAPSEKSSLTM